MFFVFNTCRKDPILIHTSTRELISFLCKRGKIYNNIETHLGLQFLFSFFTEEFAWVQFSCFQTPSGSSRSIYRNKSFTFLQNYNYNTDVVALEIYSNIFHVFLNFVNFGITGTKRLSYCRITGTKKTPAYMYILKYLKIGIFVIAL